MPELPEVETLRRVLVPLVEGKVLTKIRFFRKDLRFPIPVKLLEQQIVGKKINAIRRKGKYLLFETASGKMILHLGMSGRLVQCKSSKPEQKHTHVVFLIGENVWIHFVDPRRFGCLVWQNNEEEHKLLRLQGPDPYSKEANANAMKQTAKRCKGSIKTFLMNGRRIAGIGNIYACESLFKAGIHPNRSANRLSLKSWNRLLTEICSILDSSIAAGGTTLKDFFDPSGSIGYYTFQLLVYGREGEPCSACKSLINRTTHSGRSTFFCKQCQRI